MTKSAEADNKFKLSVLKAAALLRKCDDDDLHELARRGNLKAFPGGKSLTQKASDSVYILQSGVVAELQPYHGSKKHVLVDLFGAKDTAGLVDLFNAGDHSRRDIHTLTPISAIVIPSADFLRIVRRSEELTAAVLADLASRAFDLGARLGEAAHSTLEARLAGFFSRVADLNTGDDWNPTVNIGHISQTGIAEMLGVSREHVNRTLSMWDRSGLIFQNQAGEIIVQNRKRLHAISSEQRQSVHAEKVDEWLWEIDAHLDHGLNQAATHLALEAVKRAPRDLKYKHKAVLATARSGSVSEALALIEELGLDKERNDEEIACLRPRLLRDLAFLTDDAEIRRKNLEQSAKEYNKAFKECGGYYSGINAASGFALLNEKEKVKSLCQAVTEILSADAGDEDFDDERDDYWRRVTLAEAKLLEGDSTGAASLFRTACAADDSTSGKKATTRRQLIRLSDCLSLTPAWLEGAVPQARPLFFSGPLAASNDDKTQSLLDDVLAALDNFLAKNDVGWAYGALASGADIAIAERLLENGVNLNVCLPLAPAKFIKTSVYAGGDEWVRRFENCMRAAAAIEWDHRVRLPGRAAYRLGAYAAMGKTIRHAQQLETEPLGFFAAQSGMTSSQSLSIENFEAWKKKKLDHEVVEGRWPKKNGAEKQDENSPELFYAMIVQNDAKKPVPKKISNSGVASAKINQHNVEAVFFDHPSDAIQCAEALASTPAGKKSRIWLDAGVEAPDQLRGGDKQALHSFVTAACRPVTEPGRIFSTESFTHSDTLLSDENNRYEYVGYVNTREKLDPCAMYLFSR